MPARSIALCAAAWAFLASACAIAQPGDQPAGPGPAASPPRPHAAKTPGRARRAAAPRPAVTPSRRDAYELVPKGPPTSALARARQNAFGTPDDEDSAASPSRGRLGIGLGGAGGTTPGMQIGF